MEFNINDLEKYRNKIMKSKKKVLKFDNGYSNIYSLALIANNWVFAKRNIIKVKNENWDMFKIEVTKHERVYYINKDKHIGACIDHTLILTGEKRL